MLQEKIFHFSGDLCTFILLYFLEKINSFGKIYITTSWEEVYL